MPANFKVPAVEDNADGWGPTTVPEQLEGIPYAPFTKSEKIGRISDFTQSGFNKYGGRYGKDQAPGVSVFNFFHNEEEDSFHLVDNRPTMKTRGARRFQPRFMRRDVAQARGQEVAQPQQRTKGRQFKPWQMGRDQGRPVNYSSSVDIRPEWSVVEQIPFSSLTKLNFTVAKPEEIMFCGVLEYYDKSYDRVTPKAPCPLRKTTRVFRSVTTSDDPIIRKLASEDQARVFITDALLTTLMCAPRSVYSWDIVVTRAGDKLFFDKRDGSNLELLTVAETAPEAVPEDKDNINGVQHLSIEATATNQAFSQQVSDALETLKRSPQLDLLPQVLVSSGKKFKCGAPHPFVNPESNEELAATAYRYRKYKVSEDVQLVVRCEVDGVMTHKGQDEFLSIKALNEYDPKITGVDWRQKLDAQRGAVLATELKNNANKLARWTAAAMISGTELIKLGYISRHHPRENRHHTILGTQVCKSKDFAQQINLNMDNCWGIVRALVDLCLNLDEGKYLLVKEPNKPIIRLYNVPGDSFTLEQNYSEEPIQEDEEAPEADVGQEKVEDKDDE